MTKHNDTHGGNIWHAAKKTKKKPENILDFSASLSPYTSHSKISEMISSSIEHIYHYPDTDYTDLKEAISSYLGIPSSNIMPANGSSELIYLIPQLFKPKNVLIPIPTFSEYEKGAALSGCNILFFNTYPDDQFALPVKEIAKHIKNIDMLFICNPNNPTGVYTDKILLLELFYICRVNKVLLVIDEAFIEFMDNYLDKSIIKEAASDDHLIVIRSLTKILGIPGLRIGYAVSSESNIARLKSHQIPWSVNSIAESIAIRLLKEDIMIKEIGGKISVERGRLSGALRDMGLKPFKSCVNFILSEIPFQKGGAEYLSRALSMRGILIRDCSTIRGLDNRYFRVAVKGEEDNILLIDNLKEVFSNVC